MRIYIVSDHPIYKMENLPAELFADDIIDLFRDNETFVFDSEEQALSKKKKYFYSLTFEEHKNNEK